MTLPSRKRLSVTVWAEGMMPGRILVVDDTASNRLILRAKLASAYYDVLLAENGTQALEIARNEQPDMILLDVMMPDLDGHTVCRMLKADTELAHIPVIMVTGANSTEERLRGLEAGADDFLTKPVNDLALFARVRNLMRTKVMFDELRMRDSTSRELGLGDFLTSLSAGSEVPGTVMLAPPDVETGKKWRGKLCQALNVQVIETGSEREAANLGLLERPDVYVVHQSLAEGGDGLRLVSALRARTETRHSAIILIVGEDCLNVAAQGLELGASDYVMEPFDMNELVARLRSQMRRKQLSDQLRTNMRDGLKMAVIDPLTGLFNRRYATQHMAGIIERSRASNLPFAVMIMDLDRFKSINDRFGHDSGDAVLTEFSRRLRENVRGVDLVARLGGEEFLLVMPDTGADAAAAAAERVRRAVENVGFPVREGSATIDVTVSIGAAMSDGHVESSEALIRQADAALYVSKAQGRNCVSFARIAA